MKHLCTLCTAVALCLCSACDTDNPRFPDDFNPELPGLGGGTTTDDGTAPDFDPSISAWDGSRADDSQLDVVGTDKDFYHELNSFDNKVTITYRDGEAAVSASNADILCHTSGAYVAIDLLTNSVAGTEIIISGKSSDGGLKIYGSNKFKLTMNGVDLTSRRGPAINSQCKKRIYVDLQPGTTNRLTDSQEYADDIYYAPGASASTEDRKGCFFSEGNLIFSGSGVLEVAGLYRHGIATDGYLWMRPGVTLAITEAAKNAIHVKGDQTDNIGVHIAGGLIYANVASSAGKGIKTDLDIEVAGGKLLLNTSGNAIYDSEEADTSSAACLKADGSVEISGGSHTFKSTGTGGKGISADGELRITGGETTITTTGGKYTYSSKLTSSPKGVKAEGDIHISGGKLNISVTGVSDGSEGLESKSSINIDGGEVYSYAYDDAINAAKAINVAGGKVFAYAKNNDGIDSNGSLTIGGGIVIGIGTNAPESGIDCDNSNNFRINGGYVVAIGGTMQSNPSSSSTQYSVTYNGITASKDAMLSVLNSSSSPILTFELPRSISGYAFFFSTPDLSNGATYSLCSGGSLTVYASAWNGLYLGGKWAGGTQIGSFSISSKVTTVGSGGGMGGGMGGGPGGGMGGGPGWF